MKRALLFLVGIILANSAGSAPPTDEFVRIWTSPSASVRERADAVNRRFTNNAPIPSVVAVLGTNFVRYRPLSTVWVGPGPEPRKTSGLIYRFSEESVVIDTTADLTGEPLTGNFTGAWYFSIVKKGQPSDKIPSPEGAAEFKRSAKGL